MDNIFPLFLLVNAIPLYKYCNLSMNLDDRDLAHGGLLPCVCLQIVHSSHCLHWVTQVLQPLQLAFQMAAVAGIPAVPEAGWWGWGHPRGGATPFRPSLKGQQARFLQGEVVWFFCFSFLICPVRLLPLRNSRFWQDSLITSPTLCGSWALSLDPLMCGLRLLPVHFQFTGNTNKFPILQAFWLTATK